jgi:hypothetical protein
MGIVLPQNADEWLAVLVPLFSILLGLAYFLAPRLMLRGLGLTAGEGHRDAIGEGRSTFAGFPIGIGACALAFGQPILVAMLGLAFAVASAGKLLHIVADGARSVSVFLRLFLAAGLAALAFWQAGFPEFEFVRPATSGEWATVSVAGVTVLFGLICFALPTVASVILRLQPVDIMSGTAGELRGTLAGYYLAAGALALSGTALFAHTALGAAWLATAFGRIISMLSDRAFNGFNWLALLLELVLAGLPLALVFGMIA